MLQACSTRKKFNEEPWHPLHADSLRTGAHGTAAISRKAPQQRVLRAAIIAACRLRNGAPPKQQDFVIRRLAADGRLLAALPHLAALALETARPLLLPLPAHLGVRLLPRVGRVAHATAEAQHQVQRRLCAENSHGQRQWWCHCAVAAGDIRVRRERGRRPTFGTSVVVSRGQWRESVVAKWCELRGVARQRRPPAAQHGGGAAYPSGCCSQRACAYVELRAASGLLVPGPVWATYAALLSARGTPCTLWIRSLWPTTNRLERRCSGDIWEEGHRVTRSCT